MPITGRDMRQYHDLLNDMRKRKLVDRNTNLPVCVTSLSGRKLFPVAVKHIINLYTQRILDKYLELYKTQPKLPRHFTTTGPPVFSDQPSKSWGWPKGSWSHESSDHQTAYVHLPCIWSLKRTAMTGVQLSEKTIPDRCPTFMVWQLPWNVQMFPQKLTSLRSITKTPMAADDIPKTSSIAPFSPCEFSRMSFGLINAAQTFQSFIDECWWPLDCKSVKDLISSIWALSPNDYENIALLKTLRNVKSSPAL